MSCWLSAVVLAACRIEDLLERINNSVVATFLDLVHLLAPILIASLLLARLIVAHQEVLSTTGHESIILGRAWSLIVLVTCLVGSDKQTWVLMALETVTTPWPIAY